MRPAGVPVGGSTVSIHDRTFVQLVGMAYNLRPADIAAPGWASELRFDIEAKLPEGAKPADANSMLQTLLAERFGLKSHRETRAISGYALVVAKDGPKLPLAAPSSATALRQEQMKEQLGKRMAEATKAPQTRPQASWWSNATTAQIASAISDWLKAPVVDETGLTGKYAARLDVARPESPDDSLEYRVSQALAKLGLKIESRKTSPEFLVIDAASKTPNGN